MPGTPRWRGPQIIVAAALVVLAIVLFVSAYVPRQLVGGAGAVAAVNLVLRGLAFAANAGALAVLFRALQDHGSPQPPPG